MPDITALLASAIRLIIIDCSQACIKSLHITATMIIYCLVLMRVIEK